MDQIPRSPAVEGFMKSQERAKDAGLNFNDEIESPRDTGQEDITKRNPLDMPDFAASPDNAGRGGARPVAVSVPIDDGTDLNPAGGAPNKRVARVLADTDGLRTRNPLAPDVATSPKKSQGWSLKGWRAARGKLGAMTALRRPRREKEEILPPDVTKEVCMPPHTPPYPSLSPSPICALRVVAARIPNSPHVHGARRLPHRRPGFHSPRERWHPVPRRKAEMETRPKAGDRGRIAISNEAGG